MSNLACKYIFLLWCGFSLYVILVIRWTGLGIFLPSTWLCCTCSCRQDDSSEWPQMVLSCATLGSLSVGMPLGSLYCSCGELVSSFGSRDVKNDHIYGTLYIGNSWQGSETPLHESSHHTYCTCLYSCALSIIVMLLYQTCCLVFRSLVACLPLLVHWSSLFAVSSSWKYHSLVLQKIDLRCLQVANNLLDVACSSFGAH